MWLVGPKPDWYSRRGHTDRNRVTSCPTEHKSCTCTLWPVIEARSTCGPWTHGLGSRWAKTLTSQTIVARVVLQAHGGLKSYTSGHNARGASPRRTETSPHPTTHVVQAHGGPLINVGMYNGTAFDSSMDPRAIHTIKQSTRYQVYPFGPHGTGGGGIARQLKAQDCQGATMHSLKMGTDWAGDHSSAVCVNVRGVRGHRKAAENPSCPRGHDARWGGGRRRQLKTQDCPGGHDFSWEGRGRKT